MTESAQQIEDLTSVIRDAAVQQQFDLVKMAPAVSPAGFHPFLNWLNSGYSADMDWIDRRRDAYRNPGSVLTQVRSVIMVALNYHNEPAPAEGPRISRYAWGTEDYHSIIRRRLKAVARLIRDQRPKSRNRVIVDTAPLLERDYGRLAGIGWFGKNTMLINRDIGSWFFLGAVLTTEVLRYDQPFTTDHCGTCTRCLDACPTQAFPEPRVLDARRCISYLTIERRSADIPDDLKRGIGSWIFGCDICQEVCPWNRFASRDSLPEFRPRTSHLTLERLLGLTAIDFDLLFENTPLHRTGRDVIVRNSLIAAANLQRADLLPEMLRLRNDKSPLVRAAADWAVSSLGNQSVSGGTDIPVC
ncbi:MAG: tRNA epoxyqueuosine(34) reductase QueG [Planctomycetaceae bacterium]